MTEKNNFRILIIDDNPEIHSDFLRILTTNTDKSKIQSFEKEIFGKTEVAEKQVLPQFIIDTASQGQEGVEKISKAFANNQRYALAFVDIRMPPGWDGIETIKHIWEVDPNIQIVICSAYSDYSWEETVQQLGQRENLLVLKKPFDSVAVRQLSFALTKKWQMLQDIAAHTTSLEERISERTRSLQESLAITRGTLESSTDAILVINDQNMILDYNQHLIELWHIQPDLMASKDARQLLAHIANQLDNKEEFSIIVQQAIAADDSIKIEKLKCKDERILEFYSQPYLLNTNIAGRILSFHDVTKRAALEERIEFQSRHDNLTGLPNRMLLMDRIKHGIEVADRHQSQLGILFLDLDRFKLINDSLSHSAGDELLKEVANRLLKTIRKEDTCARLGGDEFVIVAMLSHGIDMQLIGNKILEEFNKPFRLANHDVIVNTSIGVSIYPLEGKTADELLSNADIAMYRAKALGKNQLQFYTAELGKESSERLTLENELRQAVLNNEFFLVYQPQFDITTEELISLEALIRWQHPTKGVVLPMNFIPLAEEMGLIGRIGAWVLKEACTQNKTWQKEGLPPMRMAVNIASEQIKDPNFVPSVKQILAETDLDPNYLELEITENVIIETIEMQERLKEIRAMGVHIALDDFGIGYSCMNFLKRIAIDRIKIDQSFIQAIEHSERGDEAILKAIIAMASNLNLNVLAEGVETKKQLDFLKSKTCDTVQGYLFSKPLPANEVVQYFDSHKK